MSQSDAEKLEKLKEKYTQAKQANVVLKKGLLEKQDEFNSLEKKLKEQESAMRTQLEEIDQLQFQNGRLSKQLTSLNGQLEDVQKSKQQSGWSVQGLISGKQQLEALQRLEDEKRILSGELNMKSQENEDMHVQLFDDRKRHDEAAVKLQAEGASAKEALTETLAAMHTERGQCEQLTLQAKDLRQKLHEVEERVIQAEALKPEMLRTLEDEKDAVKHYFEDLKGLLSVWVPADEDAGTLLGSALESAERQARDNLSGKEVEAELLQQTEALQNLISEKATLLEKLRNLQGRSAVLRSNFEVVKSGRYDAGSGLAGESHNSLEESTDLTSASLRDQRLSDAAMSSWQRALVESPSISAQERIGLHQAGFFVHAEGLPGSDISSTAGGSPNLEPFHTWEKVVRKLYQEHTRGAQEHLQVADARVVDLYFTAQANADRFQETKKVKQQLVDEVSLKQEQLDRAHHEISNARKKYDSQLVALTEDICKLSAQVAEKESGIFHLHGHKLKCGHCGTWNLLGKLIKSEAACKTCNQKVLVKA